MRRRSRRSRRRRIIKRTIQKQFRSAPPDRVHCGRSSVRRVLTAVVPGPVPTRESTTWTGTARMLPDTKHDALTAETDGRVSVETSKLNFA